jgi:two-component system, cell cycle sensor histidine kinase and response regulator CckA
MGRSLESNLLDLSGRLQRGTYQAKPVTLRAKQMEVTEVAHPKLALEIAKGRAFDLLITDVIMPGMNGPELHQQLIQTQNNLKVLYMSGYTGNTIAQHGILDIGVNFIQKPFVLSELNKMLNVVMD